MDWKGPGGLKYRAAYAANNKHQHDAAVLIGRRTPHCLEHQAGIWKNLINDFSQ